jgi:hypothetical protein
VTNLPKADSSEINLLGMRKANRVSGTASPLTKRAKNKSLPSLDAVPES